MVKDLVGNCYANIVGRQEARNAQGTHVGRTIRNVISHPVCGANGARPNYYLNCNPLPTHVVKMLTQRKA